MTTQCNRTLSRLRKKHLRLSLPVFFLLVFSSLLFAQTVEICDNAIDDDGDGLIDLNDDDCQCAIIEPVSFIPNPSFEDLICCPQERSELNCAVDWIQASEPTTDLIHNCGWQGWDDFPPPKPFPDGDGIMGFRDGRLRSTNPEPNWKEYAGACLINPLLTDVTYRFEFDLGFHSRESSPALDLTFFGATDCQYLPFGVGNTDFGCPTNGPNWTKLASKTIMATNIEINPWINSFVEIIPDEDIYAIVLGPPCGPTTASVSTYYFFDNLILDDAISFDFRITEQGHPCQSDFSIQVPIEAGAAYQWYKEGIALLNETQADLTLDYGEGNYQVRVIDGNFCGVSKSYNYVIPILREEVSRTICSEETIVLGDQLLSRSGFFRDTIVSVDGCDSMVNLTLNVLDEAFDTLQAKIFEGESFDEIQGYNITQAGRQIVSLPTNIGCDSSIYLNLDYYNVYIPNVFSPNNDGVNDNFVVLGNEDLVEVRDLRIFNRWGTQIYEAQDLFANNLNGWNGEDKEQFVLPGVYVYLASVEMDDGKVRQFSGHVSLIK